MITKESGSGNSFTIMSAKIVVLPRPSHMFWLLASMLLMEFICRSSACCRSATVLVEPPVQRPVFQGKRKHIKMDKFGGLSWDWLGGKNLFVVLFGGHCLWGREHTVPRKSPENPQNIPGQSANILFSYALGFILFLCCDGCTSAPPCVCACVSVGVVLPIFGAYVRLHALDDWSQGRETHLSCCHRV